MQHASFFRQLFSEEGRQASFSRITSGLIVIVMLGCIAFLVLTTGKMPDLMGAAAFVSGSVTALYGANKIASAIASK